MDIMTEQAKLAKNITHDFACDLSAQDARRSYERDGVVLLKGVLSKAEIENLRRAVDHQMAHADASETAYDFQKMADQFWKRGGRFRSGNATRFDLERLSDIVAADKAARPLYEEDVMTPPRHASFFYEAAGWRHYKEIRQVAMDSRLPELVADLLDSNYVNFWEDTTFVKTPGATLRTPFHQDYTYFQIQGDKCCIVWITLDEVDAGNGALEYVIGSHRWGRAFAPNVFVSQTPLPGSPYERLPDIEAMRDRYDIRTVSAKPGDVIIHHVMTVHGSCGNRTANRPRRGISFRYCGDDVRYHDKPGAMRQPWVCHSLKNGDPLYADAYPRVWPRAFPGAETSRLYD